MTLCRKDLNNPPTSPWVGFRFAHALVCFSTSFSLKNFSQSVVSRFRRVELVEKQRLSLRPFCVTGNPTVFVSESPGLKSGATRPLQAGRSNESVDISLPRQAR